MLTPGSKRKGLSGRLQQFFTNEPKGLFQIHLRIISQQSS